MSAQSIESGQILQSVFVHEANQMDTRKAIDGLAMGLMLLLCMTWGLQQVAIKVATPDMTPLFQIALRSGIAALMVALLIFWRGERISFSDGTWRLGLLVGCLFGFEYLMVGEGLRYTTASHMIVFLYTAPIFAALGLHWHQPNERMHFVQWIGIAIAFAGIITAFCGKNESVAGDPLTPANLLWGDFLGLIAGAAWGATTVVIRCSRLARTSTNQILLYQLIGAFVLLTAASIGLGRTGFNPTNIAWGSLLFQALIVSFGSLIVWFWLLGQYQASRLGVLSFMTPLFGVTLCVWLLNEPLESNFVAGSVFVFAGIVLVSGYEWMTQILASAQTGAEISNAPDIVHR
jgi:drug/metabolite transporter (DMT)-like permease